MIVKNNYKQCLTNVACSIQKYFDLPYKHNTLKELDDILLERQPQNVVFFLFDGLGSNILRNTLSPDSFLVKHVVKDITTVFPATTTAATTSLKCGLNPVEHGWVGWDCYISPIDKIITLFLNCEKFSTNVSQEFMEIKDQIEVKSIIDEINKRGEYYAKEIATYNEDSYQSFDEMFEMAKAELAKPKKKYVYIYNPQPDSLMHDFGWDSVIVKDQIQRINDGVEQFCQSVDKDTLVIVMADHGHITVDNIFLEDYPQFVALLERPISIEPRAASFKVKAGKKQEFETMFKELFGQYFSLYTAKDVIDSHLFGEGEPHKFFAESLQDYLAVAEDSNKAFVDVGGHYLYSQHAGYTDQEIYIPLIVK